MSQAQGTHEHQYAGDGRCQCERRPSIHDPITKSYAIDQIADIEKLRAVAHRMWEAFLAAHSQASHAIAALAGGVPCEDCEASINGERETGCEQWRQWQAKVSAGFGSL